MRICILENKISDTKLEEEAEKFESREAMIPYLIMNTQTFCALRKIRDSDIVACNNGSMEFLDYKILFNEDLRFGDVDIR